MLQHKIDKYKYKYLYLKNKLGGTGTDENQIDQSPMVDIEQLSHIDLVWINAYESNYNTLNAYESNYNTFINKLILCENLESILKADMKLNFLTNNKINYNQDLLKYFDIIYCLLVTKKMYLEQPDENSIIKNFDNINEKDKENIKFILKTYFKINYDNDINFIKNYFESNTKLYIEIIDNIIKKIEKLKILKKKITPFYLVNLKQNCKYNYILDKDKSEDIFKNFSQKLNNFYNKKINKHMISIPSDTDKFQEVKETKPPDYKYQTYINEIKEEIKNKYLANFETDPLKVKINNLISEHVDENLHKTNKDSYNDICKMLLFYYNYDGLLDNNHWGFKGFSTFIKNTTINYSKNGTIAKINRNIYIIADSTIDFVPYFYVPNWKKKYWEHQLYNVIVNERKNILKEEFLNNNVVTRPEDIFIDALGGSGYLATMNENYPTFYDKFKNHYNKINDMYTDNINLVNFMEILNYLIKNYILILFNKEYEFLPRIIDHFFSYKKPKYTHILCFGFGNDIDSFINSKYYYHCEKYLVLFMKLFWKFAHFMINEYDALAQYDFIHGIYKKHEL